MAAWVRGFRFDWDEEVLFGAGEQPVHQTVIGPKLAPHEPVHASFDPLDLELLSRLDAVTLPDISRQHNLALRQNGRFHQMYDGIVSRRRQIAPATARHQ
jgi:hypothetical protein